MPGNNHPTTAQSLFVKTSPVRLEKPAMGVSPSGTKPGKQLESHSQSASHSTTTNRRIQQYMAVG